MQNQTPDGHGSNARIASVVLAAGASTRFGTDNKLHALIDGCRVIERVLLAIKNFEFKRRLLVVSPDDVLSREIGGRYSFDCVPNPDSSNGMATSFVAAMSDLNVEDLDGIAIFLGDMPFLDEASISAVISRFEAAGATKIVRPRFGRISGHPVIFPFRFHSELGSLAGDEGAAKVLRANQANLELVEVSDKGVIRDIDTIADIERADLKRADWEK